MGLETLQTSQKKDDVTGDAPESADHSSCLDENDPVCHSNTGADAELLVL